MDSSESDTEDTPTSPIEETFHCAAEFVQKEATSGKENKLDQDIMLKIYGLYKVSTIGKCTDPKPGLFNPRGRAKWYAWVNVSDLSKEQAMSDYIRLIQEHYHWDAKNIDEKEQTSSSSNASAFGGNSVSSFAIPSDDNDDNETSLNPILHWVKENNFIEVETWLTEETNSVNFQDKDGLSLLHWSVDRGHYNLTVLLLERKANPLAKDNEGLTPLDYAITCEHYDIAELLESCMRKLSL